MIRLARSARAHAGAAHPARLVFVSGLLLALLAPSIASAQAGVPLQLAQAATAPGAPPATTRSASLAAKGLFIGDQLSPLARDKLTDFIIDIAGRQIEVVLVMPTGPWQIDGSSNDERALTPARLEAVKRFLSERGVDTKRIFVESRIDAKAKEPRLDVQAVTRPGND